jgi:hypothetical protein
MNPLLELVAAWLVISVPASVVIGRWMRSVAGRAGQ